MQDTLDNDRNIDLTEVDSVVSSIIKSFVKRARFGKEKYGKTLDRSDLRVSEWINHAQEELMDGILYLEKLKQSSGTVLLNHVPSPPDTPPPLIPIEDEINYFINDNNSESICTEDCACDMHRTKQKKTKNVKYQISVLAGEQCNKEINVIESKTLSESKLLYNNLKDNVTSQGISALILYAVDKSTNESKEIKSWFYDEIDIRKEYNTDKYDSDEIEEELSYGF